MYLSSAKNTKTHEQHKIVNILNENYVNVPKNIHDNLRAKDQNKNNYFKYFANTKRNIQNLLFLEITQEETLKIIKSLNDSSANDINCMSPKFIKHFAEELSVPLTYLINVFFSIGYFPDELKISKIIPLYKQKR